MDTNIAFLYKDSKLAIICMKAGRQGGEVLLSVPPHPARLSGYPNFFDTVEGFEDAIELCQDNDWKLFHKGKPNYG